MDSGSAEAPLTEDPYASGVFSLEARGASSPSEFKINALEAAALGRLERLYAVLGKRLLSPGHALEVGCSTGSFLALLAGLGWTCRGLEPDREYAKTGAHLYGVDIEPVLLEQATLRAEHFDVVLAFHVLEHLGDPRGCLVNLHAALRDGGTLFLEVPVLDRPGAGDVRQFLWTRHPNVFSRAFIDAALLDAGLAVTASGFARNHFWAIATKASVPHADPVPSRKVDPPVWKARALRTGFTIARKMRLTQFLWKGAYYLATRMLSRHELRTARLRGPRCARMVFRNAMARARTRKPLAHFGIHTTGNAGDVVLSDTVRPAFEQVLRTSWCLVPVHRIVTPDTIQRVNSTTAGVVVGGGGLFLADSNPNTISGWQWPISAELIGQCAVPLVVFAVGYNRFRGQEQPSDIFRRSLEALVGKSLFVGLRNQGSIREMASILPSDLQSRLTFQPCPTTVLSYLPLGRRALARTGPHSQDQRTLALNVAGDRFGRRFGARMSHVMSAIARMAATAQREGWRVVLACHSPRDSLVRPYLDRERVDYSVKDLFYWDTDDVLRFYASVDLAVGMRGHAQMIPFGLGVPIASLIAHDKLAWFLEDIGHPEWGADVSTDDFSSRLAVVYRAVTSDLEGCGASIAAARGRLWEITTRNLLRIAPILAAGQ